MTIVISAMSLSASQTMRPLLSVALIALIVHGAVACDRPSEDAQPEAAHRQAVAKAASYNEPVGEGPARDNPNASFNPALMGIAPKDADLEFVEPHPPHAKAAAKIRDAFIGQLPAGRRKQFAELLQTEDIQTIEGDFPEPHRSLAIVCVGVRGNDTDHAKAIFLTDHVGEVTEVVRKSEVSPGEVSIHTVDDPDGDGIQDVELEFTSGEKTGRFRVIFEDGQATLQRD
jgi:hypothetical protein